MMEYRTTSALLGISLAVTIFYLVRRDRLHLGHALFWIAGAIAALMLGLFPTLSDRVAQVVGVHYGPTLVLSIGIGLLIVKALHSDISVTRIERDLRRLAQRVAMYEADGEQPPAAKR